MCQLGICQIQILSCPDTRLDLNANFVQWLSDSAADVTRPRPPPQFRIPKYPKNSNDLSISAKWIWIWYSLRLWALFIRQLTTTPISPLRIFQLFPQGKQNIYAPYKWLSCALKCQRHQSNGPSATGCPCRHSLNILYLLSVSLCLAAHLIFASLLSSQLWCMELLFFDSFQWCCKRIYLKWKYYLKPEA